jgi:hypothetical protein
VTGVTTYVVYLSREPGAFETGKFMWEATPGVISKVVGDKHEIVIPDEWTDFPQDQGYYHIGITSRDELGNQSDPFACAGLFKFTPPSPPSKGGIESI